MKSQRQSGPSVSASASASEAKGTASSNRDAQDAMGQASGAGTPVLDTLSTLRRGDAGPQVESLQGALNTHGAGLDTDGDFGGATHRSVKDFQVGEGLDDDGVAGPDTLAALSGGGGGAASAPEGEPGASTENLGPEAASGDATVEGLADLAKSVYDSVASAVGGAVSGLTGGGGQAGPAAEEKDAAAPAEDPHSSIADAAARFFMGDEDDMSASGTAPAHDEGTQAWIQTAGDVTSIMPPDVAKAYDKAKKAAKRGQLSYSGENSAAYDRWIRVYKAWLKTEFGQEEHRINKDIVKAGGRKAKALNIKDYIEGRLKDVSAENSSKKVELLDVAVASFEKMAADAAEDGVTLEIRSGYRKPKKKKPKDTKAVAANSSHSYGLAIDLTLSDESQDFKVREIKTGNAKNLMKYFGSPATKWMMANGASYNWHPYTNEPWHFEYNPPGLVEEIVTGAGLKLK